MDWLLRHRRTKGAGTDRSIPGGAGSSSLLYPIFIIFLLASVVFSVPAWAASDVHVQIRRIQQERMHLKAVREKLESRRGQLGRSLKKLDRALVRASMDTRQATGAVRQADVRLADLTAKRSRLEQRVDVLKRSMLRGVAAAWRYADRPPLWLDAMFGAQVTDIPHQKIMGSGLTIGCS